MLASLPLLPLSLPLGLQHQSFSLPPVCVISLSSRCSVSRWNCVCSEQKVRCSHVLDGRGRVVWAAGVQEVVLRGFSCVEKIGRLCGGVEEGCRCVGQDIGSGVGGKVCLGSLPGGYHCEVLVFICIKRKCGRGVSLCPRDIYIVVWSSLRRDVWPRPGKLSLCPCYLRACCSRCGQHATVAYHHLHDLPPSPKTAALVFHLKCLTSRLRLFPPDGVVQ